MTKFEQVGINHQHYANTKEEAIKAFEHSCTSCCVRGMHIECSRCAISNVHSLVLASFDNERVA